MNNLRPLAFLSLPIFGTLMLLNFGLIRPYAKIKIIKSIKTADQLLIVKR